MQNDWNNLSHEEQLRDKYLTLFIQRGMFEYNNIVKTHAFIQKHVDFVLGKNQQSANKDISV